MEELEEGAGVLVAEDGRVGFGEVAEGGGALAVLEAVGAGPVFAFLGGWAFGLGAVFSGDSCLFFRGDHGSVSFRVVSMQTALAGARAVCGRGIPDPTPS